MSNERPFFGGKDPNAWDVAMAPRVFLARIGCRRLHGHDPLADFPETRRWLQRWAGRASWRNACSWDEDSIEADLRAALVER